MIIQRLKALRNSDRDIKGVGFTSIRYLLERDKMGFTVNRTEIPKGGDYFWHYKNHLEACLCVSGECRVKDLNTGQVHEISEGDMYALDNHDPHLFTAITDTVLISVFNPPLEGSEIHKKDGSYGAI